MPTSSLDEIVNAEMQRWNVPGLVIGVLHQGRRDIRAYGVASTETQQPVRGDTLFQVGSISKLFTATLVMRMVEAGRLDLDRPILEYLPELRLADRAAQSQITLRHTLTHTSGLFGDCFDDYGWGDDALQKYVANLYSLRQLTAPGELWTYCNSGFGLAGAVVERVGGQPFEQAMREQVFALLGLERSFYFAHEAIVYPVAVGHGGAPAGETPAVARHYPLPRASNAAGGVIADVNDLLSFAAFHMGDGTTGGTQVLRRASLQAMQQAQIGAANWSDSWGIGWDRRTLNETLLIGHGGSTNGFQARLTLAPTQGFAIAVLTNSGRGSAAYRPIVDWALQNYCGLRTTDPQPIKVPADQLERFAGLYRQPFAETRLNVRDGGLDAIQTMRSALDPQATTRELQFRLEPIGAREFYINAGELAGMRVDFIGADNAPPRFMRMGGRLSDRVGGSVPPRHNLP